MSTFSKYLQELMKKSGDISKYRLSVESGISYSHIANMVDGKVPPPKIETMEKLAGPLNASVLELEIAAGRRSISDIVPDSVLTKITSVVFNEFIVKFVLKQKFLKAMDILRALPESEQDRASDLFLLLILGIDSEHKKTTP